jgi:hypothetical protein
MIVAGMCLTSRGLAAQSAPLGFAGCYHLEIGKWSPPLAQGDRFHAVPHTIELDTVTVAHGWYVTPDISWPTSGRAPMLPHWSVRADSLEIQWSNGFTPTTLRLKSVHVGELSGAAIARADAVPPDVVWPAAPVTARRVACANATSPAAMVFAARIAGCYALHPGPWRSKRVHAGDVSTAGTPLRFELTADRIAGMEELLDRDSPWFHVRGRDPDPARNAFVAWRRYGDSIHVADGPIPSGSGVSLDLVLTGRDLVGRVVVQVDYEMRHAPSIVSRIVRARRVNCIATPAAESERSEHR